MPLNHTTYSISSPKENTIYRGIPPGIGSSGTPKEGKTPGGEVFKFRGIHYHFEIKGD